MGLRLSVLTVIAGLIWAMIPVTDRGGCGCLQCHRPHHEKLGVCMDCHRGDPRTNRIRIAHYRLIPGKYARFRLPDNPVIDAGRRLITQFACRRCHRIGTSGNRLAADLDRLLPKVQPQNLAAAIKEPVPSMPDFYFSDTHVTKLVNAILDGRADIASGTAEAPLIIHFENNTPNRENLFDRHCGSCHRLLTRKAGGLGRGHMGPNLSGLLSEFYPQNFKNGQAWDAVGLKKWTENPRNIRPNAQMIPLELTDGEFTQLVRLFQN
ncbi:MAG: c-type cytochrome [Desulfobacterales bacterium]|uniref:C-type cytochrome n=1 Tax=Candidatus Desulfatibia profunda TaxID=2841695 RepID=A0A8J6NTW4_9BACT|nr:c-type cytochrome [Candidatus Desulfatibia profunda]MBL7179628.1 c-type cytochrome [Desulfobacterales bacterium]